MVAGLREGVRARANGGDRALGAATRRGQAGGVVRDPAFRIGVPFAPKSQSNAATRGVPSPRHAQPVRALSVSSSQAGLDPPPA